MCSRPPAPATGAGGTASRHRSSVVSTGAMLLPWEVEASHLRPQEPGGTRVNSASGGREPRSFREEGRGPARAQRLARPPVCPASATGLPCVCNLLLSEHDPLWRPRLICIFHLYLYRYDALKIYYFPYVYKNRLDMWLYFHFKNGSFICYSDTKMVTSSSCSFLFFLLHLELFAWKHLMKMAKRKKKSSVCLFGNSGFLKIRDSIQ